ncbi:MAG: DUF1330 domain-containing protein [Rhodospirillaceae bacterium]|nr:DUF1330 domain-containing protein [Rhodospirillaceae bacterium]
MTAYILANNHTTDYDANLGAYRGRVTDVATSFGGRYLARGVPAQVLEGQWLPRQRNVISRWDNQAAAEKFWFSDVYQKEVRPNRVGTAVNDIGLFEGEGEPAPLPANDEVYMLVIAQLGASPEKFVPYAKAAAALITTFGGRYLVRGAPAKMLEGEYLKRTRLVLSAWPNMNAALSFWNSDEYQHKAKPLRDGTGIFDVALFNAEKH